VPVGSLELREPGPAASVAMRLSGYAAGKTAASSQPLSFVRDNPSLVPCGDALKASCCAP